MGKEVRKAQGLLNSEKKGGFPAAKAAKGGKGTLRGCMAEKQFCWPVT